MLEKLKHIDSRINERIFDYFLPLKPARFLSGQAESLKAQLPYETYISEGGRYFFILTDGGLGTFWDIEPISHELQSEQALKEILSGVTKIFEAVSGPRFTFQFIYDCSPSPSITGIDQWSEPTTFPQKVLMERIKFISSLANDPGDRPRLVQRSCKVFLRIETNQKVSSKGLKKQSAHDQQFLEQAEIMAEAVTALKDNAKILEDVLQSCAKLKLSRGTPDDFITFLRKDLSGSTSKVNGLDPKRRIGDQIVNGHLEWNNDGIEIGSDTWEVLSWSDQPNVKFDGMLTELLKIDAPIRCIVNIRPNDNRHGLESLANAVKNGGDALKERQRDEVYETEKRLAYGERLLGVSVHIMLKNQDRKISDPANLRGGENLAKQLSASTNIPFFVEKFASQAVFMACLPFCYSKNVAGFVGRECRVLSSAVSAYLPLFCGTKGDDKPCQLMQSRSGEAIWINPRCSPTNPHLAILGSSGGGKSFYLSNFILSELATDPDAMIFHIDCITSCEYLAKAVGEEIGANVMKPPETFPNLFKGEITKERLPTIVSVIDLAVDLTAGDRLSAAEKVILSDAITKTYRDNLSYSSSVYEGGNESTLGKYVSSSKSRRVPRLSEIVNSFTAVCQKKGVDESVGEKLREKLLPLFGSGPYSILFDKEDYEEDAAKAGYYLYDLVGVQGDKTLATITSLIVISDVLRVLNQKQNRGRKGLLVIDECGVNLSGRSEYLETFVNEKWPTLRKKGIVCIGITNKADHYSDLPAPSTIWSISANKLILPMTKDDITIAEKKRLIEDPTKIELIKSLRKKKGQYSECLWIGESMSGTFSYVPTGYDYWTAVNQDHDVFNLEYIHSLLGSYREAIIFLAGKYPMGVLDQYDDPRPFTPDEQQAIKEELKC